MKHCHFRCYIIIKFCYLYISLLITDINYLLYSHLSLLTIALFIIMILGSKATSSLHVFVLRLEKEH